VFSALRENWFAETNRVPARRPINKTARQLKIRIRFWGAVIAACLCCAAAAGADSVARLPAADPSAPTTGPIPPTLFGMHVHIRSRDDPWPQVPYGSYRILLNKTAWSLLNPSEGNYDWRVFDWLLATLKAQGVEDVIYSFTRVPSWASSKPDAECEKPGWARRGGWHPNMAGTCAPPADLNPDGSGTDKHWKDFVSAIVSHAKNSNGPHIKYWEIWNEPNHPTFWTGTFPQMVRMSRDAATIIKSIDPQALIVSPPVGADESGIHWLDGYLSAGGGDSADIMAFHGYLRTGKLREYPSAGLITAVERYRRTLAQYGQSSKPLWNTEASWGDAALKGFEQDQDFQAAFLAQFYLMHWSLGVPRLYWFAWNDLAVGTLWLPGSGVTKAALAYGEVYKWLVGSTMTRPCTEREGLWVCGLKQPGGQEAEVVWSDEGTRTYTPRTSLKRMRDLDGNVTPVAGAIKVSGKPLLLEAR
jgi:hypothetical protein